MKNAFVKIIAVVLTLAAVIIAVGLLKPTSAQTSGKLKIDVVLWEPKDDAQYRVGLENGMDQTGGATITVDSTNKNILHIETKLPTVGSNNPVFKLYKNKTDQTFATDSKNLIADQEAKADLLAHVEFDKEEAKTWEDMTTVQIFEGVRPTLSDFNQNVKAKTYFVLNKQRTNLFVIYLTPSELEEKLALYQFNTDIAVEWNKEYDKFFTFNVSAELRGRKVAVNHVTTEKPADAGVIVMSKAGDPGKITGDIKAEIKVNDQDIKIFDKEIKVNQAQYVAVIGKGSPNTKNDNVYPISKLSEAVENTFKFGFIPEKVSVTGLAGTTAKDKRTIFVETILPIIFEDAADQQGEALTKARHDKTKEWFTVYETANPTSVVEIEEIQTNFNEKSTASLVIILKSDLDNKKEYTLKLDNKKTEAAAQKAEISLSLDKVAPIIEFDEERKSVPFNKEFDFQLIPGYTVSDDRDGNITESLYVPGEDENNEKRFIDPSVKGEYEVLFKVVDAWGNVSEKTIVFVVE